ncbi:MULTISPECIES: MBL fold metallo-hydrolase [Olivibacter]|uniref:MBL fold metallo-hydrolase n=2 Tax=Olivibacter TaxID=376469 RepID=A0ABV6HSF9_9SPHI|nr:MULTISPECIES: MBL fold metallo-hydrolase [Olivibacter]MCL4639932.1 MBL fold metallo-hydrolase [Olivibacter sp. UJ_SKK_5.1]MDM8174399.1 MBL fold metallo-hydrolase [Olivibacter sp. 47]MDX3916654.1 MBL fold metallo-hydrolase [Pseudosphingobacterium sp.]QEL01272.1 MBL fold metallo-hydrolase [Olivibacter sp. LS-1]
MKKLLRILKYMMVVILSVAVLLAITVFFYIRQDKFGQAPSGKRLERIKQSPNYRDGQFQNLHFTPTITEGYSFIGVLYKFFFGKDPRNRPTDPLPTVKTNLQQLDPNANLLVWFGHSSYLLQLDGVRYLVDPVFCGNASPVPGSNRSFKGTDIYTAADMPSVDYLLITHDHYDHLDYETIVALKDKVTRIICGLGVGAHFEHWGYEADNIIEKDWNEKVVVNTQTTLHTLPTRHFAGRSFSRNNTLWLSFLLETPTKKIYLGGDSGYDTHFATIGKQFGPIDLAILDNGQYNPAWQAIHMLPEEVINASKDLGTKRLFPVHSSKFALSLHAWDEPLKRISILAASEKLPFITPMIGEVVRLDDPAQTFTAWWKGVK